MTVVDKPSSMDGQLLHLGMLFDEHPALFTDVFGGKDQYIEHFGIKGMKWGVRKPEETGPGRQSAGTKRFGLSPNNQKAVAAAFAVGLTVGAAVLASKGANVTVWNSGSTKTLLAGARASSRILGTTGKVLVKSSAKTATVGAKVGFKTGKIAGKLGGKLALAGGKAAGRAAIQNGTKFHKEFLDPSAKMTYKLGSHLSYKLIGRGTPIVSEVAKSKMSLNPIDLLLNTRSDRTLFSNRGGRDADR